MVGAMVTEFHLQGLAAGSQAHQLVPKANAEGRNFVFKKLTYRRHSIITGLWITRAIGRAPIA